MTGPRAVQSLQPDIQDPMHCTASRNDMLPWLEGFSAAIKQLVPFPRPTAVLEVILTSSLSPACQAFVQVMYQS